MSQPDPERAALYAAARAYLEWELELSGFGVPARGALARSHPEQLARAAIPEALAAEAAAPAAKREVGGAELAASGPARPPMAAPEAATPGPPAAQRGAVAEERAAGQRARPSPSRADDPPRATLAALAAQPTAPGDARALSDESKRVRLAQLDLEVQSCQRCELAKGRTHTVFARGNPDSPVVFIGEGPGQEEDRQGSPFVGPAGQLLDRMVAAMGFGREDVYICNIVKCRPPGNRTPLPSEAGACAPFLLGQLDLVQPSVIVALGRCAAENLGLVPAGGSWRGRWGKFRGIDVMPTYHPAFLLRSPEFKRPVWEDLQKVMQRLKTPG